jgi:hypothetical protein
MVDLPFCVMINAIGGWLLGPPPQMIVPQMDIKYNNP